MGNSRALNQTWALLGRGPPWDCTSQEPKGLAYPHAAPWGPPVTRLSFSLGKGPRLLASGTLSMLFPQREMPFPSSFLQLQIQAQLLLIANGADCVCCLLSEGGDTWVSSCRSPAPTPGLSRPQLAGH